MQKKFIRAQETEKQCVVSLSNQPRQADDWKVLLHCLRCKIFVQQRKSHLVVLIDLSFSYLF